MFFPAYAKLLTFCPSYAPVIEFLPLMPNFSRFAQILPNFSTPLLSCPFIKFCHSYPIISNYAHLSSSLTLMPIFSRSCRFSQVLPCYAKALRFCSPYVQLLQSSYPPAKVLPLCQTYYVLPYLCSSFFALPSLYQQIFPLLLPVCKRFIFSAKLCQNF